MKKKSVVVILVVIIVLCLGITGFYKYESSLEASNNKKVIVKPTRAEKPSEVNEDNNVGNTNKNFDINISQKVKNYILYGQNNLSEAKKIKWSKTFLDKVDIESMYKKFVVEGGNVNDVEGFAKYITVNAPIQANWQSMFQKDLYDTYGQKVVKLVYLNGDLYQAYINQNGSEVPYVVVSSRTGYFHG